MRKILLILILLLSVSTIAEGQNYPVQAFVQLTPPYSGYLQDYTDDFNNQLSVHLTLNDLSLNQYPVKLKFIIEGNGYHIESNPAISFPPIYLSPGIPVSITGSMLYDYLKTSNLIFSGIDAAEYDQSKILPEGFYSICVIAYDYYHTDVKQVSNITCASAWFSLNEPPLLNLPVCGTTINDVSNQFITFNWTPLHTQSPFESNTNYVFELFEVRPQGTNPNIIATTTIPIFTTITDQMTIVYGPADPILLTGMQYVWRVKAVDPSGRNNFRNQGYSEVCTFSYGNIAENIVDDIDLLLQSNGTGPRQGTAWWNGSGVFNSYMLQVRKKSAMEMDWFPLTTSNNTIKINNLEPQTIYECRVKGVNSDYESEWSNISEFTTYAPPQYNCNSISVTALQSNIIPLTNAAGGMIFQVGQFEMLVTSIQPLNQPGRFYGIGRIHIPFAMFTVNVSFQNIFVDENLVVRDGRVDVINDGLNNWLAAQSASENVDYYYSFNIDSVYTDANGNIIILDNGNEINVVQGEDGMFIIQDADGTLYLITQGGTISQIEPTLTINLSQVQKDVIKRSLELITEEYNASYLGQLKQNRDANRPTTIQLQNNADPFAVEFLGELEEGITLLGEVPIISDYYFASEDVLLRAEMSNKLSLVMLDSENYYLVVTYVKADNKTVPEYIDEQLTSGKTIEETAALLKPFIIEMIGSSVSETVFD